MSLRQRDTALRELMDDPQCDPGRLDATLRRFGTVNRLVSGWGGIYRAHLRPHLAGLGRPARVLDLGCGGGDLIGRLAGLARRDGLRVQWLGVDPDTRAHAVARARERDDVRFRCTDSTALRAEGERFDAVVSNHVLHHLTPEELAGFAADSLALSSGPVLHADIARGRLAYGLYAVGIAPLAPGTFLHTDGLRSIRRSYRPDELQRALEPAAAGAGAARVWHVDSPAPFRLLARGSGHA
ncbi:methyltransferase domain-containing protein [Microbacterium sp. zg.Y625]|uniref:methyltransferase domain-containing protein n=1 Tax=Microbacterium jiangjiandongii TaxID=3049071 RepID=UPI00214B23FF|nr:MULTISPECIES: methyltransferase domain-containing protein [unclassified Microbacterium]MCR2793338.1 methyltransferase domain-containing protein [Microbacterium sp. zg.Y625]WIM25287.1 methyltransferase domain-containing protein [Microbacterium sp. zg-Y625]